MPLFLTAGRLCVLYRPLDMQTIKRNIESGAIRTTEEFQRDMMLMFTNAMMYNNRQHNVHRIAKRMHQDVMQQIEVRCHRSWCPTGRLHPASWLLDLSLSHMLSHKPISALSVWFVAVSNCFHISTVLWFLSALRVVVKFLIPTPILLSRWPNCKFHYLWFIATQTHCGCINFTNIKCCAPLFSMKWVSSHCACFHYVSYARRLVRIVIVLFLTAGV